MKTYNRLMRINYNGKLYDIFSDENHKKVFLEVKVINGEEKYFYISVREYMFLNNVYNIKKDVYFSESNSKNKKKFTNKLFIILGASIITLESLTVADLLINKHNAKVAKIYNELNFIGASYDKDNIKNIEQLESLFEEEISFNDIRKTLDDNNKIPKKYKLYIEEYINALEERYPQANLRCFNENLKKMEFEIIENEKWKKEKYDGYMTPDKKKPTITVKSNYGTEKREKDLVFHELTHALRIAYIQAGNDSVYYNYRIASYGLAFDEAFTELFAEYLASEDNEQFFDYTYRSFSANSYSRYVTFLHQILKLAGDKYTLEDFFNFNVTKLENFLSEYGLSDLIDLYDVDLNNFFNDIDGVDMSRINELENKIIELRVHQELEKGTDINEIYKLSNLFNYNENYQNEIDKVLGISNYIKTKKDYQYCITGNTSEILNDNNVVLNPLFEFYNHGNLIYSANLYDKDMQGYVENNLYVVPIARNGDMLYKICKKTDDKYIDIETNNAIKSSFIPALLIDLIEFYDYGVKINMEQFLNSKFLQNEMINLNMPVYELITFKDSGSKDYEIYQNAKETCFDWIDVANFVLDDKSIDNDWSYRFTNNSTMYRDTEYDSNGKVVSLREYSQNFKIYYNDELVYNNNSIENINGKEIRNNLYMVAVIEDNKISYKLAKSNGNDLVDILTDTKLEFIGKKFPLSYLLGVGSYNVEINLEEFLKPDFINKHLTWNTFFFKEQSIIEYYNEEAAKLGFEVDGFKIDFNEEINYQKNR